MQANCPSCSQRIVIDDAKVPDRPFKVKCPKCQTSVSLPGKGAAYAPGAPMSEAVPPSPPPPAATGGTEEMRSQMMAQLRREMNLGESAVGGSALVCLPDRGVAGAITVTLTRLGYQVDTIEDPEEGARLLEQGVYSVVATSRSAPAGPRGENLYQRTNRLSPEARRRLFLVLIGDEYKTGDGTQAWTTVADLVLNTREVSSADVALRNTVAERARLYHVFLDARRRFEETAG